MRPLPIHANGPPKASVPTELYEKLRRTTERTTQRMTESCRESRTESCANEDWSVKLGQIIGLLNACRLDSVGLVLGRHLHVNNGQLIKINLLGGPPKLNQYLPGDHREWKHCQEMVALRRRTPKDRGQMKFWMAKPSRFYCEIDTFWRSRGPSTLGRIADAKWLRALTGDPH